MWRQINTVISRCAKVVYSPSFKVKLSLYSPYIIATASIKKLCLVSCIQKNHYSNSTPSNTKDTIKLDVEAINEGSIAKAEANDPQLTGENDSKQIDTMNKESEIIKKKKDKAISSPWNLFSEPVVVPPNAYNVSGYIIYKIEKLSPVSLSSKREEGKQHSQYLSEIGKMWRALSKSEQLEYGEKARIFNEKRKIELSKWWETVDLKLVALENTRRKWVNKSGLRKGKDRLPNLVDPRKPKLPAIPSALFLGEQLKGVKVGGIGKMGNINRSIYDIWRKLPEEEKNVYKERYNASLKIYHNNMKEYKKLIGSTQEVQTKARK